ncbi:WD40-repeat-containing domain protein [Earliella scabrosa]|nr:WD40-repeat-containing domain protein [Earliella scabrosa]
MTRRYTQLCHLNCHEDAITAVVFSPQGNFLATGSLDGKLCIWNVEEGRLLYRHIGEHEITSIVWLPDGEEELLFGTRCGHVARLTVTQNDLSVSGFWAHAYPVEHLAIKDSWLASGALKEVKLWRWDPAVRIYVFTQSLPGPATVKKNALREVIVTSLHWTTSKQHELLLLVTYMYHGVYLYDARDWHSFSGHASLSQSGTHLAISNLDTGFDVYRMEDGVPVCSFEHEAPDPDYVPVQFIHGGHAIFGGNSVGRLGVWDIYLKRRLDLLSIPNNAPVRAIAGHCKAASDPADYRFLLATGAYNLRKDSPCILWEAQDPKARAIEEDDEEEDDEDDDDNQANGHEERAEIITTAHTTFTLFRLATALLVVLVAYVSATVVADMQLGPQASSE